MLSFIIPYREPTWPDLNIRKNNLFYVKKYFSDLYPEAEFIIGEQNFDHKDFSRSNAINNGVKKSKGDTLIICDADVFLKKEVIDEAIKLIPKFPFIIPFGYVIKMNRKVSNEIINGKQISLTEMEKDPWELINIRQGESTYGDKIAGGIQIITRELFDKIKGYDERFIGHGYEDSVFCWKLKKEIGSRYKIFPNEKLYHLYHPQDITNLNNRDLALKIKKELGVD